MASSAARILGEGKEPYSEACVMASEDQDIHTKAEEFMSLLCRVVSE